LKLELSVFENIAILSFLDNGVSNRGIGQMFPDGNRW